MRVPLVSLLRFGPMMFIMGTIFFLSHQSGDSLDLSPFPGWDKVAHMSIYGLLAASIIYGINPIYRLTRPYNVIIITVCMCVLYGFSDELHQSFIPYREQSFADVLADFSGGVCVCLIWFWGRKWGVTSS